MQVYSGSHKLEVLHDAQISPAGSRNMKVNSNLTGKVNSNLFYGRIRNNKKFSIICQLRRLEYCTKKLIHNQFVFALVKSRNICARMSEVLIFISVRDRAAHVIVFKRIDAHTREVQWISDRLIPSLFGGSRSRASLFGGKAAPRVGAA
jgi:hypothetical protein